MKNFFDILADILMKKSGGTLHEQSGFQSKFSTFMIVRYLSMNDKLLPYANELNKLQLTLSPTQVYLWCYHNIPKQRSSYIKYISKPKKKKTKKKD